MAAEIRLMHKYTISRLLSNQSKIQIELKSDGTDGDRVVGNGVLYPNR